MSSDAAPGEAGSSGRLLEVADVHVSYGQVTALRGVDVAVDDGEIVSEIGPNGAGKSTLADAISGFLPYRGEIHYRGTGVAGRAHSALVKEGLIYCTETRDLFDFMDVEDNLRMGAYRHHDHVDERLEFVYDLFPPLRERAGQTAHTMSGGEQQMLAIGRALMGDPDLLLLDEPTLGLAPVVLEDISDGIDQIQEEGVSILLCEQNVTFAMKHADRIYLLENGQIEREGTPETLRGDDYIQDAYLGE
ncbi:MAG TPA: ABC transporter ATP-binding protein [Halobacteriales archaeon]|nr:ABC transporter ATP-binding protein [Halobacteriales archaeon]